MKRIIHLALPVAIGLLATWHLTGQPLAITSPQPGDTLLGGSSIEITWTGGSCENVKLRAIWNDITLKTIAESTPNDGSYTWTVFDGHTEPMRLECFCGEEWVFTSLIREYSLGTIEVTFPDYHDTLVKGSLTTLTWNENVEDDVSIKLYHGYMPGSGPLYIRTLAESTPGDGAFEWIVPFDIPVSYYKWYVIGIWSLSDQFIYDYSRGFYFSENGSICVDQYEPNNHIDSASLNVFDPGFTLEKENYSSIHATIHQPGDWDHYLLHVEQPGNLELKLANVPAEFDLQLYNQAKEYVAGSFTTGNETINEDVTPGLYYIIVGSLENASSCDVYDLYLIWAAEPYLEVIPESQNLGPAATTTTFDISSNEEWNASEDVTWFSVIKTSDELLTVNLEENTSPDPRSAEITIFAGSADPVTVTVNQEGRIGQPLTITSPQLYDTLMGGSSYEITWTGGSCENVRIRVYWYDVRQETISDNTPNDGSYVWTVLDGHTEVMYLIIYCGEEIVSKAFIREYSQGTIEVTSPAHDYSDTLEKGSVYTINWKQNVSDDVSIKLYFPGAAGPEYLLTITDSTSGDGVFDMNVPYEITFHDLEVFVIEIQIQSLSNPLIYDYGNKLYLSYKGSVCADRYETNNHFDSASVNAIDPEYSLEIENFTAIHGTIHEPGDWDYYLLQVDQPGNLDLLLYQVPDHSDLQLYNQAKEFVAGSFTTGTETINQDVAPGNYYIIVSSQEITSSCNLYTLYMNWAAEPYLEANPELLNLGPDSATTTFEVSSNQEWTALEDATWLSVIKTSDELLTVNVEENTSPDPRSAQITISAGSADPVSVTVNQEGVECSLSILPEVRNVGPTQDSMELTVTANILWNVDVNADWLSIRVKGSSVVLVYDENESVLPRNALIIFSGGACVDTFLLIQYGLDPIFEVNTEILQLGAEQGEKARFQVLSNVEWSLLNLLTWLGMEPTQGTTSAEVEVEALESNNTGAVRSGSIVVSGNETSHVVTVIQDFVTGWQDRGRQDVPRLRIYPNPAGDHLHVDLGSPGIAFTVRVFDNMGSQVINKRLRNTAAFDLELSGYPEGLYMLEITQGTFRKTGSFAVLR